MAQALARQRASAMKKYILFLLFFVTCTSYSRSSSNMFDVIASLGLVSTSACAAAYTVGACVSWYQDQQDHKDYLGVAVQYGGITTALATALILKNYRDFFPDTF